MQRKRSEERKRQQPKKWQDLRGNWFIGGKERFVHLLAFCLFLLSASYFLCLFFVFFWLFLQIARNVSELARSGGSGGAAGGGPIDTFFEMLHMPLIYLIEVSEAEHRRSERLKVQSKKRVEMAGDGRRWEEMAGDLEFDRPFGGSGRTGGTGGGGPIDTFLRNAPHATHLSHRGEEKKEEAILQRRGEKLNRREA